MNHTDVEPLLAVLAAAGFLAYVIIGVLRLLYRRRDTRLRALRDGRTLFWNDDTMARVRAWLASHQCYQELAPTLAAMRKMRDGDLAQEPLSPSDHERLECLDRFLTFLLWAAATDAELRERALWRMLALADWLKRCHLPERPDLDWYVKQFFPLLLHEDIR